MNNPLVSVIVPCYNQAQFLSEALESVLLQTYTNWECIIVNDGSADNTEKVAKNWLKKDDRIKYISKKNEGVSKARNIAIENAVGEFILPLDADDKISKRYIELALNEFIKNKNLKVVYCEAEYFGDKKGKIDLKPFTLANLSNKNMIFCTALYRKSDWKRVFGYDDLMVVGLEDWEFWISILKKDGEVKKINYLGFFYRIKNNSRNRSFSFKQRKILYDYLSIKHPDFFIEYNGNFFDLKLEILTKDKQLKSKKHALKLLFKSLFGTKTFKLLMKIWKKKL